MSKGRQKLFMITGKELFALHLKGEGLGLPDDAQIREIYYDVSVDLIEYVVESDEYPDVEGNDREGDLRPGV